MKLSLKKSTIVEIIAALFILLFVYTALSKFFEFANFRNVLGRSPFIGNNATLIAWALPITELVVSLLLFIPRTRFWGLYSSLALMTTFTLYIGYMLIFIPHVDLPCSCGGVIQNMTWSQHLIFNVIFVLSAALGIWLSRRGKTTQTNETSMSEVVFT